ncbi:hypothetical protein OHB05_42095 [Streptomyces sp. NBC_00638]|uniref:hypothetical protein n=1 Tax=unclassified Streptomyces TaxID=2593676 RepID=UPI0022535F66|nr:hypothetical protein [Streptomyces sp. NBC_00638]MCX5009114.1 hypothetical protein [Streptomyces sp. NBC_00638]
MSSTCPDSSTLERLVSAAVAAPSMHNTQPWRFRLGVESPVVEIHATTEEGLPHEDPHGRAPHSAGGAALFNLRVAVTHLGWKPIPRRSAVTNPVALLVPQRPYRRREFSHRRRRQTRGSDSATINSPAPAPIMPSPTSHPSVKRGIRHA